MTDDLKTQLAQVAGMLASITTAAGLAPGAVAPAAAAPGAGGWLTPPPAQGALPQPAGWSVVMEIEVQGPRGQGKATIDLCYAPESWKQAPEIVAALIAQGYPVKVWVPKAAGTYQKKWGG